MPVYLRRPTTRNRRRGTLDTFDWRGARQALWCWTGGWPGCYCCTDQWSVSIVADTQRPPRLPPSEENPKNSVNLDPPLPVRKWNYCSELPQISDRDRKPTNTGVQGNAGKTCGSYWSEMDIPDISLGSICSMYQGGWLTRHLRKTNFHGALKLIWPIWIWVCTDL